VKDEGSRGVHREREALLAVVFCAGAGKIRRPKRRAGCGDVARIGAQERLLLVSLVRNDNEKQRAKRLPR